MYDGLTGRYSFGCPVEGEARVRLSSFRALERLPGADHPAVFKVRFLCACGDEHDGLVSHDQLDWAPLGGRDEPFYNVMTSRIESAASELLEESARRIGGGEWPWSFFCYPEGRSRPVFPSSFRLLAAAEERLGVALRCPACSHVSVNLVTARHVDEPFFHDRHVGVVEHIFGRDREAIMAEFRAELESWAFDAKRRLL
jgi:hypothetical protein